MQRTFESAQALAIANLDRYKFNDVVKSGFFACAPRTERGQSREFSFDDLIAVVVLSRLLMDGIPPRKAGPIACEAGRWAAADNSILTLHFGTDSEGNSAHGWPNGSAPGHGPYLTPLVINLKEVRSFVTARIRALPAPGEGKYFVLAAQTERQTSEEHAPSEAAEGAGE